MLLEFISSLVTLKEEEPFHLNVKSFYDRGTLQFNPVGSPGRLLRGMAVGCRGGFSRDEDREEMGRAMSGKALSTG